MLPPVNDVVLENNPDFATLYHTLTTAVLNPDGSSKNDASNRERDVIRKKLKAKRLQAAKEHLLIHAISTAAPLPPSTAPVRRTNARPQVSQSSSSPPSTELPQPLVDLLLILPPLLSPTPQVQSLLADPTPLLTSPPLCDLPSLLPDLAALVSAALHQSALSLARHTHPTTNPSYLHRHLSGLAAGIAAGDGALAASKAALSQSRLAAAAAARRLLAREAALLAGLARTLEAKHGAAARSLELRAAEVALEARRGEAEAAAARHRALRAVYPPAARAALAAYAAHLRDARTRAAEACRARAAELAEYGVVVDADDRDRRGPSTADMAKKEQTMRELARAYRDVGREIDLVRRDLDRLGRA